MVLVYLKYKYDNARNILTANKSAKFECSIKRHNNVIEKFTLSSAHG